MGVAGAEDDGAGGGGAWLEVVGAAVVVGAAEVVGMAEVVGVAELVGVVEVVGAADGMEIGW
jgi:hypothetical protein